MVCFTVFDDFRCVGLIGGTQLSGCACCASVHWREGWPREPRRQRSRTGRGELEAVQPVDKDQVVRSVGHRKDPRVAEGDRRVHAAGHDHGCGDDRHASRRLDDGAASRGRDGHHRNGSRVVRLVRLNVEEYEQERRQRRRRVANGQARRRQRGRHYQKDFQWLEETVRQNQASDYGGEKLVCIVERS